MQNDRLGYENYAKYINEFCMQAAVSLFWSSHYFFLPLVMFFYKR